MIDKDGTDFGSAGEGPTFQYKYITIIPPTHKAGRGPGFLGRPVPRLFSSKRPRTGPGTGPKILSEVAQKELPNQPY